MASIPYGDLRRVINGLRRMERRFVARIGAGGTREIREILEILYRHTPEGHQCEGSDEGIG
jgi:hypothetical protein